MVVSIRLPQYNESSTRRTRRNTLWRLWTRYKKGWVVGVVLFIELVRFLLVFYRDDGRGQWAEEHAEGEDLGNLGWGEENLGREVTGVKRLVIVTCHAIWVGGVDGKNETKW
ncbi:hypothetical protein L873DRAFT_1219458 [Choiromyces venosus 120613-1]|uniref:Uncharacterized protein n=1 Tax=Choiromyces venosus 120613-1 TaxID=1336337 RepID=A0A3N4JE78_9PEZI|nr:hypothetical protein L873DRAFT_1219458 [Choiromyces venosus 120613-1]